MQFEEKEVLENGENAYYWCFLTQWHNCYDLRLCLGYHVALHYYYTA